MIKILLIALALGFLLTFLKSINSEIFTLALIGSSVIILLLSIEYVKTTFGFFNEIISSVGVDSSYYYLIIKMIAIGYLTEFTCSSLEDMGLKSFSDKVVFVGKIIIFSMSLPIIKEVFNLVYNLLK